jgi:hypothetical protein
VNPIFRAIFGTILDIGYFRVIFGTMFGCFEQPLTCEMHQLGIFSNFSGSMIQQILLFLKKYFKKL